MEEFNLYRLIEASPFSGDFSDTVKDALVEFLMDTGATLENVNIDDLIINGLYSMDEDEYNKNFKDNYLLCEDEGTYYVFN